MMLACRPLCPLHALLDPEEISVDEFHITLKAGDLVDMVVILFKFELISSSLLDEPVLEDTKVTLHARIGSSIIKNPSDYYYPIV